LPKLGHLEIELRRPGFQAPDARQRHHAQDHAGDRQAHGDQRKDCEQAFHRIDRTLPARRSDSRRAIPYFEVIGA